MYTPKTKKQKFYNLRSDALYHTDKVPWKKKIFKIIFKKQLKNVKKIQMEGHIVVLTAINNHQGKKMDVYII